MDGGTAGVIGKDHTLQMGDFYMKDGSLLGKETTLTANQQATCIGIVTKAGRDDKNRWIDKCDYKDKNGTNPTPKIHGYVLALYGARQQ